jgi:hypothetical protein
MDAGAVVFGLVIVGPAVAWWLQPARRARRKIAGAMKKRLAETRDGELVAFRGVIAAAGEPLWSPLTGRECVAYRFSFTEAGERLGGVVRMEHAVSFVVAADGMEAVVRGEVLLGLEPRPVDEALCPGLEDLLQQRGRSRHGLFGEGTFRCQETLLCAGDEVSVLGRISIEVDQAGLRESARGLPVRRIIRGEPGNPVIVGPP